jgi:hypothetical protein
MHMHKYFCGVAAIASLFVVFLTAAAASPEVGSGVDIELAFDTTGSMAGSLQRARQDAQSILAGVRAVVPTARFAVVSFRDHDNPGGEYQTIQPMTTDTAAIEGALEQLQAVSNPSPGNLDVESYNLAFHRSYADSSLGWNPEARKIVLVVGDAEPYGGGAAGIAGCTDTHVDPDGLNVKSELSGMQRAGRTLVMIRAVSKETTTSLNCYSSLVGLTYPGGTAQDANASNLVTPLLDLVRAAVAPISIVPTLPVALPGRVTTVNVAVSNPSDAPLRMNRLALTLPHGFSAIRVRPSAVAKRGGVTWASVRSIRPHSVLRLQVVARASAVRGIASLSAKGTFQLASGVPFTSTARTPIRVTAAVAVRAAASTRTGSIAGAATLVAPHRASSFARVTGAVHNGRFSFTGPHRRRVVVRPWAFTLSLARGDAIARLGVVVVSTRGLSGCKSGTRGTFVVTDRTFATFAGNASAAIRLPRACSVGRTRWLVRGGSVKPS